MKKQSRNLIALIFILATLAAWIDFSSNPELAINFGPIHLHHPVETRYGLDLVGGVQALLEADLSPDTVIDPEAMRSARAIIEKRVNGLGISETVVQQAGDRRILVELPGERDPQRALEVLQRTGLLEFVDFSGVSQQDIAAFENAPIETDYGLDSGSHAGQTGPRFHTLMTGADLQSVQVTRDRLGNPEVAFTLNNEGAAIFSDFTSQHVGDFLAIALDKQVISAPVIRTAIPNGKVSISGNFDLESANDLAVQLRYGSLPIPLKVVSSQTVGPTLGQNSLHRSWVAGLIGMGVVTLFMAFYYRLPGLLADLALLLYTCFTLAIFKWIGVTLTLPGIAGFVLSIGMAVDANILIFSRIREELRAGRALRPAIDLGWTRAWPSIRDSNFSTLITSFILFWFGSAFGASLVKGFSLTLAIGVLVSMFTAIVITRTFLHLVLDNIEFVKHPSLFGV